jgi:23S rRNA (guanosine2251-2'-O)-methyltransferase
LYGFHPVREALRHRPSEVSELLIAAGRGRGRRLEIEELARRHGIPVREVDGRVLDRASATHNGLAARVRAPIASAGGDPDLVVLLEDVQDPRNLGALLRVCEGAGVGRVLVRDRGSAPVSPVAVKASAGAAEWVVVERFTNTAQVLRDLKQQGYWVFGAAPQGDLVWDCDLAGKVVLCLGGEERGLRARTVGLCDRLVSLPMRGRVASLNVATAASGLLYEALRQRWQRRPPAGVRPEGDEPRSSVSPGVSW